MNSAQTSDSIRDDEAAGVHRHRRRFRSADAGCGQIIPRIKQSHSGWRGRTSDVERHSRRADQLAVSYRHCRKRWRPTAGVTYWKVPEQTMCVVGAHLDLLHYTFSVALERLLSGSGRCQLGAELPPKSHFRLQARVQPYLLGARCAASSA